MLGEDTLRGGSYTSLGSDQGEKVLVRGFLETLGCFTANSSLRVASQ